MTRPPAAVEETAVANFGLILPRPTRSFPRIKHLSQYGSETQLGHGW